MTDAKEQARQTIAKLVERFQHNLPDYRSGNYNETQVRRDFIDPLFVALGWDIDNQRGLPESQREVIHEDRVKVEKQNKAPDYGFRVDGERQFFVEAKKPSVNLSQKNNSALQVRRYAWSAKLPVSILTDFEEFAIYDGRVRPDSKDKSTVARLQYFTFQDYLDKWDELYDLFSREAVLNGSLDRFAGEKPSRGQQTVDAAFLQDIEKWRDDLAKEIAFRNEDLTQRELNFAVQITIDRIIFLRICEDRGIEAPSTLLAASKVKNNVYKELLRLFTQADARYNSGLFHFKDERGRDDFPDTLTPKLEIDDNTLNKIIEQMYFPKSPYEFSVMPAEILGQVYEQFLGKVIRLTEGHRAKVEEKPEVKKAGGVYYTPSYIVDYIVKQTVGKLLDGKTPKDVEKLRILDPACGSGSFLIGAYQYLLDWHVKWYTDNTPAKHKKALYQTDSGDWKLTLDERKRILLNNIYGVDIDAQAVEVSKLSLLLKVLEGETAATVTGQLQLFKERALPDLAKNIQCGNSLIGSDFYELTQRDFLQTSEDERHRVNAFDWEQAFPNIIMGGGFDAVIGNPPYIRIQTMKEWAAEEVEFYKDRYIAASKGNYDIYVVFVERGLSLLNPAGLLGFILPHKFFNAQYGEPIRGIIAQGKHLYEIVHFGHQQVFKGASTYTCLMFLKKAVQSQFSFAKVDNLLDWRTSGKAVRGDVDASGLSVDDWNFVAGNATELQKRLSAMPIKLGNVAERMGQGIRTSANEIYVLDLVSANDKLLEVYSKHFNKTFTIEREVALSFLQGREIRPYRTEASGKVVIMPYRNDAKIAKLIPENEIQKEFPLTHLYLKENKDYLEKREKGRFRGDAWYMYGRQQNIDLMLLPKILVPDIASHASFALDESGQYAFTSGYGITLKENIQESPKYILGLLNSKVLDFYLKNISTMLRGGYFRYFTQFIEQLPIRTIDFTNPTEAAAHDRMVKLVETMLALHRELSAAHTDHDRQPLQRQLDATDHQIDKLVYELYGLSAEEIAIVEGRS